MILAGWFGKKPYKIDIRCCYSSETDGKIGLEVAPLDGAEYIWQYCKAETAVWEDIRDGDCYSVTISTNIINNCGDKYRCIIKIDNAVVAYSSVYTIKQHKYLSTFENDFSGIDARKVNQGTYTYKMDGIAFEEFCADLLRKNGFQQVSVTKSSGDFGIDILAEKDSITYAIQCKNYDGVVGNKAVQEAFSGKSYYNRMVAVVMTNSYFSSAAKETAERNAVLLWDRDKITEMDKNG